MPIKTLEDFVKRIQSLSTNIKAASSPSKSYDPKLPVSHSTNVLLWTVSLFEAESRGGILPPDEGREAQWTIEWIGVGYTCTGEKIRISIPRALWPNVPTVPLPTASPPPSPLDRHCSFNVEDLSPLVLARLSPEYDRIATLLANRLVKVSSGTLISRQDILANTADVMRKVGIREGWSEAGHRESDTAPDTDMPGEDMASGFTEDMDQGFEAGDTSYRDWENETNPTTSLPEPILSTSTPRESPGIDKDTSNVERARRDSSTSANHIDIQFSSNDIDPSDFSNHDIDPSDIKTPEIPAQTRHRSPDQDDSTFDGIETPRSSPLLARRPRLHHHRSQSSSLHVTQTPPGAPKRARRDMSEPSPAMPFRLAIRSSTAVSPPSNPFLIARPRPPPRTKSPPLTSIEDVGPSRGVSEESHDITYVRLPLSLSCDYCKRLHIDCMFPQKYKFARQFRSCQNCKTRRAKCNLAERDGYDILEDAKKVSKKILAKNGKKREKSVSDDEDATSDEDEDNEQDDDEQDDDEQEDGDEQDDEDS